MFAEFKLPPASAASLSKSQRSIARRVNEKHLAAKHAVKERLTILSAPIETFESSQVPDVSLYLLSE